MVCTACRVVHGTHVGLRSRVILPLAAQRGVGTPRAALPNLRSVMQSHDELSHNWSAKHLARLQAQMHASGTPAVLDCPRR